MPYGAAEENGIIESTSLFLDNFFAFTIDIAFDGSGQGYQVTLGDSNACVAIRSVLEALEVERWENLPGKACRVRRDNKGYIDVIGHIYKNKWSKRLPDEQKAE
jgi:hypothetical protein